MTLSRAIEVQQAIFNVLFNALEPIPVSSTPLASDRYVRVDGLTLVNPVDYRNHEEALHRFFVHAFDSPDSGTNSALWVVETLARADSALRQLTMPEASRVTMTDMQVSFTPRGDAKLDAHAFARYNVRIGEL